MSVTVANTAANLSGDTLMTAENAETLTGQKTFSNTILFSPDNSYDIGATGANRPRDVFIADDLVVGDATTIGGTLGVTGAVTLSSTLGVTGLITGRDVTVVSSTTTGATNNWAPGVVAGTTLIEWTGTTLLALTGIDGGSAGCVLIIKNLATGADDLITIAHDSASSDTDNQCQNIVTSAATPIFHKGYAIYVHDGTDWKLIAHDQGAWITPTFAAGDYTAVTAGTWTAAAGDAVTVAYKLSGKTISYIFVLNSTTVARSGGSPTQLAVATGQLGGFTFTKDTTAMARIVDNSTETTGIAFTTAGGTNITVQRTNAGQFLDSTDATTVQFVLSLEVT